MFALEAVNPFVMEREKNQMMTIHGLNIDQKQRHKMHFNSHSTFIVFGTKVKQIYSGHLHDFIV